jgi:hypothetical protein
MPELIALIGLDDGRLLEALEAHAPGTRVLALEPDAASAARFRARRNWDSWVSSGRLVYLADPDYAGADEAWRIFPAAGGVPSVLVHPGTVLGDGVARASQVLKKILFGVEANARARRQFAPRYLVNSIRNIPGMLAGSDVRALTDAYSGVPAVVVAAGPSLDAAIEPLRDLQARALIIATDTALRPLLMNGIVPPLVVGLDPSTSNLRHFLALPECRDTWLVTESALDPRAVAAFENRTFWFRVSNHHPWPFLNDEGLDAGKLDVWGSVLTAAFQLACLAGCDPIVLAGADLAFTGGQPYGRQTTFEFDWALSSAGGLDLPAAWKAQIERGDLRTVPDVNRRDTVSSPSMLAFRDWLVARAERSGRRVINATGAGILFGGSIVQQDIAEALSGSLSAPVDVAPPGRFTRRFPGLKPTTLARRLRQLAGAVDDQNDPVVSAWRDFSGDGFEPAVVGAALSDAAYTLETKKGRPAADSPIPWETLMASGPVRETLSRLPAAVARFRAGLRGEVLPDAGSCTEELRPVLIEQALGLLDVVRPVLLHADGIEWSRDPDLARYPLSIVYPWPDTTRRALLVVEALLGAAWPSERTPLDSPFFSAPLRSAAASAGAVNRSGPAQALEVLAVQIARAAAGIPQVRYVPVAACASEARPRLLTGTVSSPDRAAPSGKVSAVVGKVVLSTPRVLTDEGAPDAAVVYGTDRGVVCVKPHRSESLIVGASGLVEVNHEWPRPILNELPFGEDGAVAWGDGLSKPGAVSPGYVMYRERRDAPVQVEELEIRPTGGIWWGGTIYWSCYPRRVETWTGLASWAPGEPVRLELPGLDPLIGLHDAGDELWLDPLVLVPGGKVLRQPAAARWTWSPGTELRSMPLGPDGAASSRVTREHWTATAYPEGDVIRFDAADGRRLAMTCHYPLRLAWLGDSLLVSTMERELLLFQNLLSALDRASVRRQ